MLPPDRVLRPSKADRWGYCPGSAYMESQHPDDEGDAAREGTAAHWVAERAAEAPTVAPTIFIGQEAPNGVIITLDMVDTVNVYLATMRAVVTMWFVELKVICRSIHPNCRGTPDAWQLDQGTGVLHLWDLKYGWGVVEPTGNPQFICYLSGILDFIAAKGWPPPHTLRATVVQPRPYHPAGPVRTWELPTAELAPWVTRLSDAALRVYSPEPPLVAGPRQCKDCLAVGVCPVARTETMWSVDACQRALPDTLTGTEVGREITVLSGALGILKPRLEALQAQGLAMTKAGLPVPGYRLGRGRGSRRWIKDIDTARILGEMTGITLTEEKPYSPAQAENAGVPKEMVAALSITTEGAPKLVPGDAAEAARKAFNNG